MRANGRAPLPERRAGTLPVATSIYRLADSMVLIGVLATERGPEPLFTDVSGALTAVAFTDSDEMTRTLPEGYHVFQIQVSELLQQLPVPVALVIDPHAPSPIFVSGEQRQAVIEAAWPFPNGAHITYGEPLTEPTDLLDCIATKSEQQPAVHRWWRAWYQVADAREKLLLVYDVDGTGDELAANARPAADAAYECLALVTYDRPGQVISLGDVPRDAQEWLSANVKPFYERGGA
jgi:SseB protein C-terminal domain